MKKIEINIKNLVGSITINTNSNEIPTAEIEKAFSESLFRVLEMAEYPKPAKNDYQAKKMQEAQNLYLQLCNARLSEKRITQIMRANGINRQVIFHLRKQ